MKIINITLEDIVFGLGFIIILISLFVLTKNKPQPEEVQEKSFWEWFFN